MNSEITSTPHNFLFISKEGDILDLAWTIASEGHGVKLFIDKEGTKEIGDGFVEKVAEWREHIEQADVIVFDSIGNGEEAEALRAKGKLVIGGTQYTDKLESDRSFGQNELKQHGVKIIPYQEFRAFDTAIDYVQHNPAKYVIKPSGAVQDYKQLIFIGNEDDGSDVIRALRTYERTWGEDIQSFQLQKRITPGVEVGVGAFFNGNKFIEPVNVNFEHKKLFPGELGVSTGEMGTSMFWSARNPIFESTLRHMEATLSAQKYVGYIDLNCIVNGNGIYPLEFTSRFGFPTINIQRAGIQEPMGEMLWRMVNGQDFAIKTKRGFQVGLLIVVPPFPFQDPKTFATFSADAVLVFKKATREGMHIQNLYTVNDEWLVTGSEGIALVVTGTGMTMKDAQRQMYSRVQNVVIPNMYYRTDIGDRWTEDSDKLWSWGYL